jgi:hypothetical protein
VQQQAALRLVFCCVFRCVVAVKACTVLRCELRVDALEAWETLVNLLPWLTLQAP